MKTLRPAADPEFARRIQEQVASLTRKEWYHSIELGDGTVLPGMIPVEALKARLNAFPIPADLSGKRVLDIGAASGFCSFEMERRGAEVVAVDCVEYEEFHVARRLLNSSVDYRILDMEEITAEALGLFDYVLFFGVLYHLRHPLLGLERVCGLTKDTAFVESYVTDAQAPREESDRAPCQLEFYETDELGGQIDNWFGPNRNCLLALCRSAGFARVDLEYTDDRRAGVTCRRHWEPPDAHPIAPAPHLTSAVNNRTSDVFFHHAKDEYLCLYFKSKERGLTRKHLRVEIDGYGAPALLVSDLGADGWQANLRLPTDLAPGSHSVRVRTIRSALSNPVEIVVATSARAASVAEFVPVERATAAAPVIFALESSVDQTRVFRGYKNEYLCCYFRSVEPGLTRDDVRLEVGPREVPVHLVMKYGEGEWQANVKLPSDLAPGSYSVRVRTARSPFSDPVDASFEPEA